MTPTEPLDLDVLRQIAEAATPGRWGFNGNCHNGVWSYAEKCYILDAGSNTDAFYIATFDPPTVLKLLDQLDAVTAERDAWHVRSDRAQAVIGKISDFYNGEPCAEIRWQQEREVLTACNADLTALLREAARLIDLHACKCAEGNFCENGTECSGYRDRAFLARLNEAITQKAASAKMGDVK